MAAMVEKSLVILAQPVVVLVVRRNEGCAHGIELGVAGTAVARIAAVPSFWLGSSCHQPVISSIFLPSGVVNVICAPGVDPLKYLPMSTCVCTGGLRWDEVRSTVATMRRDL